MRQRLSELWQSGPGGKFSIAISLGVLGSFVCLCAAISIGFARMPREPRAAVVPTDESAIGINVTGDVAPEHPLIAGLSIEDVVIHLEEVEASCGPPNEFNGRYTTNCSKESEGEYSFL